MKNVAFVFPGQATHYVGMGQELAKRYKEADEMYQMANDITGTDIRKLCFEGPEEELVKTENSQPTIHTTSLAILKVVEKYGISGEVTAGFSLGQYSALVYAGALKFEDSVKLVKIRGRLMQDAVPQGLGKMCWITGLTREEVEQIVEDSKHVGHIQVSNYNCPGQYIVAGYNAPVEYAQKLALERGAKGADYLRVSGPFHTSLLYDAGVKLLEELNKVEVKNPSIAYVDNVTGTYFKPETDNLKELLKEHVYKAVMWEDSVDAMLNAGVDTFIELGSKNILTNLNIRCAEKHNKKVRCFNVRDVETLENMLRALEKDANMA